MTQDLVTRPLLPRFTVAGDRFALDVIAQNFTGQPLNGTVGLQASNLVILDPGVRAVGLPTADGKLAHWSAVASIVGSGAITCTLETSAGGDAVALPLQTKPFAVPERWSAAGQADPVAAATFNVPANAVRPASRLTLRLSPSVALGVVDGLAALIDYPYGCVEQTMSRMLPSAVAAQAYTRLGIPNPKAQQIPEIMQQGLQKLYGFQQTNGSWGWWYDDEGDIYLSAYVLYGLTMVRQAGYAVDGGVLQRGFDYLDGRLAHTDSVTGGLDPRVRAYVLYVKSAAGHGDLAAERNLLAAQGKLDAFAQAALALSLAQDGDSAAANGVLDRLLAAAVETGYTAYWPMAADDRSGYLWRTISSAEKNTAMVLRALVALRPHQPVVPKVVRWLMDHRVDGGWRDTQATAFAVQGLVDYLGVSAELQADFTYQITLNGQPIAMGRITTATLTTPITPVVVAGENLREGSNEIRIERDGAGQLYYTAALRQELFYDSFQSVSSIDQGLQITRTYQMADPGTPAATATGGSQQVGFPLGVGDVVEVQLNVTAREDTWYVLLDDPLPAGFEALNERTNPIIYGDFLYPPGGISIGVPTFWRQWGYNRKDIYDDHVTFFMTYLAAGEHQFTYLARATTPGEFSALPSQIYPMYAEDIWGRSASQQVQIAPERVAARPALAGDVDRDCRLTDFDMRQVAAAWGQILQGATPQASRDVDDNGRIDLMDLAVVAAHEGGTCVSGQGQDPGSGEGQVTFSLRPAVTKVAAGQPFTVDVYASWTGAPTGMQAAASPGGFGLTLSFDPAQLHVMGIEWSAALRESLLLGGQSRIDNVAGKAGFGAFRMPPGMAPGARLATVTLIGQRPAQAELAVAEAQAVDAAGRRLQAMGSGAAGVMVEESRSWFPLIYK
ncbi:MAG: hypothetical protein EXR62_15710 [Chloroflexi bacterium]|nr:hypothetical protein [Chloroflexota bacterium]